jgi:hypothetical protein
VIRGVPSVKPDRSSGDVGADLRSRRLDDIRGTLAAQTGQRFPDKLDLRDPRIQDKADDGEISKPCHHAFDARMPPGWNRCARSSGAPAEVSRAQRRGEDLAGLLTSAPFRSRPPPGRLGAVSTAKTETVATVMARK